MLKAFGLAVCFGHALALHGGALVEWEALRSSSPQSASGQITLALAASRCGAGTLPRLLASLARFAEPGCVRELLMIVPDCDVDVFNDFLKGSSSALHRDLALRADSSAIMIYDSKWRGNLTFPVRVLSDSQVLVSKLETLDADMPAYERKSSGGRGTNYRVQMLVKIGIASHVSTDFYMTLDQDVIAKRPFGFRDLVTSDGRARIQGESVRRTTEQRSDWWESSATLLQTRRCSPGYRDPTIGVTPAVLPTKTSLGLMERITHLWAKTYGTDKWDSLLFKNFADSRNKDWTEYTLIFAASCAMQDNLFDVAGAQPAPDDWGKERADGGNRLYSFCHGEVNPARFGDGAIFAVVQAIEMPEEETNELLLDGIVGNKTGHRICMRQHSRLRTSNREGKSR